MSRLRPRPVPAMLATIAATCLLLAGAAPASGDLRIERPLLEGPDSPWRAVNRFDLTWHLSGPLPADPYTVDYLFRDASSSTPIAPLARHTSDAALLGGFPIPAPPGLSQPPPGLYSIEIWVEGSGEPHAFANLGFDNERPPPARPIAPPGWIRAGTDAELGIEHPAAPLPVSGIRGYAFALDRGGGGEPCAGPDGCTAAETDLAGGIGDDRILIGPLQEGINIVRVLAVSNSGLRSREPESAVLHVDGTAPRIAFLGLPAGWGNGPVRVTASATDPLSGMAVDGPEGPLTAIGVDGGEPTVALGAEASTTIHGEGLHRLLATARDAVGNAVAEGQPGAPQAQVGIDETPPQVSFAVIRDPAEPERLLATVADGLSGVAARGTIAVRPNGSSERFQPLPTAAGGGRLSALWDSDSYPPGNYEFRATGFDLAGNEASSERRADGARLVLPSPLKPTTAVAFGFGGRHLVWHSCQRGSGGLRCHRKLIVDFDRRPAQRTMPFGHGIPVGGRLTASSGAPLAGLEVEVAETFAPGSSPRQRTTTVLTGPDGVFLARLAPGPSRQVSVGFGGDRQLARSSGRTLQLGIRARARLHASAPSAAVGGAPVTFDGRIDHQGAAIPSSGLAVELQFQVLGSPWSEFRTIQTDAYGRFRYPYSFSDDDSRGVRFQFRAVVPEQPGWPYESGVSIPVAVTGQ